MTVFHCGMPPLWPRIWGAQRKFGGTLKKIFRRFSPEFVPPNFKTVSAPMMQCFTWAENVHLVFEIDMWVRAMCKN